tara:strand:- start:3701 stop:4393 length:693 start_codon:yes stop_codon:yes gene_type:complete
VFAAPKKVMAFVAHPDDETIGCGGTIKKWSNAGTEVCVVFMTNGKTGVDQKRSYETVIVDQRKSEAKKAGTILGVSSLVHLDLPCQNIQNNQETFQKVIKLIRQYSPDCVITHGPNDKHRDHTATYQIVKEACWKASENIHPELGKRHYVKCALAFEVINLLPRVDFVVDTSETHQYKNLALNVYLEQSQKNVIHGINRHVDGLSMTRGYMIDKDNGEGFMILDSRPAAL